MIMSSLRPVTFCIRRMVRAVPGQSSKIARAVADDREASLLSEVKTNSPSSPSGSTALFVDRQSQG